MHTAPFLSGYAYPYCLFWLSSDIISGGRGVQSPTRTQHLNLCQISTVLRGISSPSTNCNPNFNASCPDPNLTLNKARNRFRDLLFEEKCWLGESQDYTQPAHKSGSKTTKRSFSACWAKTKFSHNRHQKPHPSLKPKIPGNLELDPGTKKLQLVDWVFISIEKLIYH